VTTLILKVNLKFPTNNRHTGKKENKIILGKDHLKIRLLEICKKKEKLKTMTQDTGKDWQNMKGVMTAKVSLR
jgi:hypothetical protein